MRVPTSTKQRIPPGILFKRRLKLGMRYTVCFFIMMEFLMHAEILALPEMKEILSKDGVPYNPKKVLIWLCVCRQHNVEGCSKSPLQRK